MNCGKGRFGASSAEQLLTVISTVIRVLTCIDRNVSAALGRPCAIQDEEYVDIYIHQVLYMTSHDS